MPLGDLGNRVSRLHAYSPAFHVISIYSCFSDKYVTRAEYDELKAEHQELKIQHQGLQSLVVSLASRLDQMEAAVNRRPGDAALGPTSSSTLPPVAGELASP
jgi:hypothetical protein